MNWRRAMFGAAIALPIIALLTFGLRADPRLLPSVLPGRPAPDFALPIMDSQSSDSVRMTDLRGNVVVLNFWASWCLECRVEHTDLSATAEAYADRDVVFFGVLYQDNVSNARAWIREMGGQSYPTLVDAGSRTAIEYGLTGVPETFVIAPDGTVAYKRLGAITAEQLSAIIDPLLVSAHAQETQ